MRAHITDATLPRDETDLESNNSTETETVCDNYRRLYKFHTEVDDFNGFSTQEDEE